MRREQIAQVLRAAKDISNHTEYVIAGSLSVLGLVETPPEMMSMSIDIDFYPLRDPGRAEEIAFALGEDSDWHQRHAFYLDPIHPELPVLPTGWRERLVAHEMGGVTAYFLEVNDIAVSKYARSAPNDFRWIEAGYNAGLLNLDTIKARSEWGTDYPDEADRVKLRNGLALHAAAMRADKTLNDGVLSFMHSRQYGKIQKADDSDCSYTGRILYADALNAVQFLGNGVMVIHDVSKIGADLPLEIELTIAFDEEGKVHIEGLQDNHDSPRPSM
jgi:hypothetical protein